MSAFSSSIFNKSSHSTKPCPEFSVLDAMQMLDPSWGKVTTKTVVNCFEKFGISKEKQSEALLDADSPFKGLHEQLDKFCRT